jgi:hypothetical protein
MLTQDEENLCWQLKLTPEQYLAARAGGRVEGLSEDDLTMCQALGVPPELFKATRAAELERAKAEAAAPDAARELVACKLYIDLHEPGKMFAGEERALG